MGILDVSECEFETCAKVSLSERLRALQENASKWRKPTKSDNLLVECVQERRKVFSTMAANSTDNKANFVLSRQPLALSNRRNQVVAASTKPFETVKLTKRPEGDRFERARFIEEATKTKPDDDGSEQFGCQSATEHVETPQAQVLKNREHNQSSMSTDQPNEEGNRKLSYLLPAAKRVVACPNRRLPSRYQNAANMGAKVVVPLKSDLHLETEDKENQEQVPKRSNLRVSSAVPFQVPVIGKDHCGVKLRHVDRKSPFPDPMLIRALTVEKHVDLRLVNPNKQSVTDRGAYLLVTSEKLIIRNAKDATVQERSKIAQLAHEITAGKEIFGYSGKPELANEDSSADAVFWHILSDKQESTEVTDEFHQQTYTKTFNFYQIYNSGEAVKIDVDSVSSSVLDSNQILLLDFGSEIYIWLGRNCDRSLKKYASALAEKLKADPMPQEMCHFVGAQSDDQKRPLWVLCRQLSEGVADSLFRYKFAINLVVPKPNTTDNKSNRQPSTKLSLAFSKSLSRKLVSSTATNFQLKDEDELARQLALKLAQSSPSKDSFIELDGVKIQPFDSNVYTERLNFWVLNGETLDELTEQPAEFDCHKCYVVEWRYRVERAGIRKLNREESKKHDTGRERGVYFYWLGQASTIKEQSFCALALRNKDRERLEHIRLEQGREHPLFISLIDGFIVSGTSTNTFLFYSYSQNANPLALMEMRNQAGRSQTTMAQVVNNELHCQRGRHCPQVVWENAQSLASKMAANRHLTLKCSETLEFPSLEPRSWHSAPRFYRVFELEGEELVADRTHFTFPAYQSNLTDGCTLIENDDMLWVWSSAVVSTFALKVAHSFWTVERENNAETNAMVVYKDNEPPEFMALFPEWKKDAESEAEVKPVESLQSLLHERTKTRSLDDVRARRLPKGCNLKSLEQYLSDEDFKTVFQMTKEEFAGLATWKKIALKKRADLF